MKVYKKTYEVLLSVPKSPAVLQLLHVNGSVEFEPEMMEYAFYKDENHTTRSPPFNAYSAPGDVTVSSVVYIKLVFDIANILSLNRKNFTMLVFENESELF